MKKEFTIPYSERFVEFLKVLEKKLKLSWWSIHSDEHPSGVRHIGVLIGK